MKKAIFVISLMFLFACTTPLKWQYTKDEINLHTLHPYEGLNPAQLDTMHSLIESWWITQENPENSTQSEIDSIENKLMEFTEI